MKSTLRDVWDEIRTQPGRVGLSFMAIFIGIASLTVLIAVLGGLEEKSRRIVKELGVNVVGILQQTGYEQKFEPGRLQERHASLLALNLPHCPVSTIRTYKVPTLGIRKLVSVAATDASLIHIRQWQLSEGRFLDHGDIKNQERHVVVSSYLSKLWNWKVGDLIMLKNTLFKVVGVVEAGGGTLDTQWGDSGLLLGERVVFVPKTVKPYWVSDPMDPSATIDAIFVRVPASENFNHVISTSQRLLLHQDRIKGLSWVTPESLIQKIKKMQNTIRLTVGSIALLCLILGGTTLTSLMVANVRDRVTEIGLRRALGASGWDIVFLFVTEAGVVTGTAAAAATLVTHLLLVLGRHVFPVPLKLGLESILTPLIVAVVLGIIFSYWPAKLAARITPSEALRNE